MDQLISIEIGHLMKMDLVNSMENSGLVSHLFYCAKISKYISQGNSY